MEMDLNLFPWRFVSFVGFILMAILVNILVKIWWTPLCTQKFLRNQGIDGPPYKLLYGSTQELLETKKRAKSTSMEFMPHDIVHQIVPHIHVWAQLYGRIFVYWLGTQARIVLHDPEMMKQILSNKFGHYEKPDPNFQLKRLFGLYGLASSSGEKWAHQRRLLNPAFHLDSLKSMVPVMASSTGRMLEKWENAIADGVKEIEVSNDFRCLTADVIARTAFGTSFEQGKHIFHMLAELTILAGKSFGKMSFLGSRFLPTPSNLRSKKLDMAIQKSLRELILNRKKNVEMGKNDSYGMDLLGLMMNAYKDEVKGKSNFVSLSLQHMVDECKTFFTAGSETTATLLTWTLILLGMHTDWQDAAREEVLHTFKRDTPNFDSMARLKLVNMILFEVLRLYPPIVGLSRRTCKKMQLGSLTVPAGVELVLPTITVNHDEELWGKDAKEFNPHRFSQGISKASTHPAAFTTFGFGPRTCIGQNFALIEAKVMLTMILQRFSFSVSPTYIHSPALIFTVLPLHGAQIIFQQLPN
ncbi:cytochrome P450 CYP749A22 isoform X1 [Cryptomeria japonica]|uniref:cytochrome P450 CYP749A22 isoform X1 n=2 Tax=Cryptomeria japonica TaxID=3369 RepID=UPI0027DAA959|nr:cytochrome P450 CYP749A22 isoform X1 [Cryptomeria japonica]XP_057865294.2 cytochrome P450 CYP749A22 isoform X1 [Cryptomeria japonica]XP_057865295.2 cytochrome P450 CYP749A22 isoform X1 [Cryptomeria japonica]XP_059067088.1 cytochrome P450 CYP749A22 isoform X1 [Cryptomeria japonica]